LTDDSKQIFHINLVDIVHLSGSKCAVKKPSTEWPSAIYQYICLLQRRHLNINKYIPTLSCSFQHYLWLYKQNNQLCVQHWHTNIK